MTLETAVSLREEDEDPAVIRARIVAMTGGDPAAHAQRARDSMSAAYARADARNGIDLAAGHGSGSGEKDRPVSETEAGTVAVIDQTGSYHHFDADDWRESGTGYVDLYKDGKRVAAFPPGYIAVYKSGALLQPPVRGGDAQ